MPYEEASSEPLPAPGGTLTYAGASYDSPYGKVESRWERRENSTLYRVTVPANCVAEVSLPGGTLKTLGPGNYELEERNV